MATSYCPACDGQLTLYHARQGQKLICPYCDTLLEVISLEPLDLDWAIDWPDEDEWAEEQDRGSAPLPSGEGWGPGNS